MQKLYLLPCVFILIAYPLLSQKGPSNELDNTFLADPTIFSKDGMYYLYGTTGNPNTEKDLGFQVYASKDLTDWIAPPNATGGLALEKDDSYGDKGFWAPQVFEYNQKFYMAYTANEHIAMATSDNPTGPFINPTNESLTAPVRQIDPFVFFDDDGKTYLYHVRLTDGNRIFVAELEEDLMSIKSETLIECISAELPWENTENSNWPVAEGPTVLKHKGLYYLIYSANDFRNPDYAVGYATSKSPVGPWTKASDGPIITKKTWGVNGTGHGDIFMDGEGNMGYVFHTHFNAKEVQPRKTAIVNVRFAEKPGNFDVLAIEPDTFRFLNRAK